MKKVDKFLGDLGVPFYLLWCGETISLIGTSLMEFALGVWVYQKTGSVLDFSGVVVSAIFPQLLVMPFAGNISDRFDRRNVMIVADITTAILTLILAGLLWQRSLEIEHLYGFNMLVSLVGAFRMPAYSASISELLPKEKLTRASGLIGISSNLLTMFAPMVAGGLMAVAGLKGIVCVDLIAFCLGSILVLKAFFYLRDDNDKPKPDNYSFEGSSISIAKDFFRQEPVMLGLLFYLIVQQGLLTIVTTMIMPLVLSHYSEEDLGIILTCGSVGGLFGAVLLTAMGNMNRLMVGVLTGDAILAFCIMIAGVNTSFILYCVCAFWALFAAGFAQGCSNSLWMRKVPNEYQGRIFSIASILVLLITTLVTLFGGIVAEKIFEPALVEGGRLELILGSLIGTGKGRGIGFMFIICGFLGFLVALSAFATRLRRLDLIVVDTTIIKR